MRAPAAADEHPGRAAQARKTDHAARGWASLASTAAGAPTATASADFGGVPGSGELGDLAAADFGAGTGPLCGGLPPTPPWWVLVDVPDQWPPR